MIEQCPACGRLRAPVGYIGTDAVCHCNTFQAFGTFFAAPKREPGFFAQAQPSHAERTADRIINAWQSSGEITLERLKDILIATIEDWYDE